MGNECAATYCPCWCDHDDEEDGEYLCIKGSRMDPEGRICVTQVIETEKERIRMEQIRQDMMIERSKYSSMWRNIVNNSMVGTGVVCKAAIVSQDGQVLASCGDFSIKREQIISLTKAILSNPGDLAVNGIVLGDDRFMYTRSEIGNAVYGIDDASGFGCIVCATKRCLMIGIYDHCAAEANNLVEELSDYLRGRDM